MLEKPVRHVLVQCGLAPVPDALHSLIRFLLGQETHPNQQVVALLDGIEFNGAQSGRSYTLLSRHMSYAQTISLTRGWLQLGLHLRHGQMESLGDLFLNRLPIDWRISLP